MKSLIKTRRRYLERKPSHSESITDKASSKKTLRLSFSFPNLIDMNVNTLSSFIDENKSETDFIKYFNSMDKLTIKFLPYHKIVGINGDTLLHYAAKQGYLELLKHLKTLNAPMHQFIYAANKEEKLCLFFGLRNKNVDIIQFFTSNFDFSGVYLDEKEKHFAHDVAKLMRLESRDDIMKLLTPLHLKPELKTSLKRKRIP